VLAAGRAVRAHVDAIADLFTQVVKTHVLGPTAAPAAALEPGEVHRITESLERLRPLAKNIVDAEMSLAMDRRVRTEIDTWMRENAGTLAGPGAGPGSAAPSPAPQDTEPGTPAAPPQEEAGPGAM
jgi:hypothetical protein